MLFDYVSSNVFITFIFQNVRVVEKNLKKVKRW